MSLITSTEDRKLLEQALERIGIIFAILILLGIVAGAITIGLANLRLNRVYTVPDERLTIPQDAATLERGRMIAVTVCAVCHGTDLGGGTGFYSSPQLAVIQSINLTSGKGGVASRFSNADWVRAIRHGLDEQGKPLAIMPSDDFYYLNNRDLGAVIAYLRSVPPVDRITPLHTFTLFGKLAFQMGALGDLLSAERIDHNAPRPGLPSAGVNAAYGSYLIQTRACEFCHGADLAGGKAPYPRALPAPNLTPAGDLSLWNQIQFLAAMRTGVLPDGRVMNDAMPWKYYRQFSNDELEAIWINLQSLPLRKGPNP